MSKRRKGPGAIEGQFIAHRVELLESDAWCGLSFAARRILDRLEIEHAHHGGKENGRLVATYADFERFGIRRRSIAEAIRLLVRTGLVEITHTGRGGNAEFRDPSRYRLTYLPTEKATSTDEWRRYRAPVPVPPSPADIDSGGENAPSPGGAKTPSKPVPARGENAPGVPFLKRGRA